LSAHGGNQEDGNESLHDEYFEDFLS
jgi:hypothetical protein